MDPKALLYIMCGMILGAGTNAQNSKCARDEFWNTDIAQCVPCTTCQKYPKTPSCDTCLPMEKGPDVWKLAAITSFSTLAIVLLAGVLLIGMLVHRYRSKRKGTLREPVEETTGPLYQA